MIRKEELQKRKKKDKQVIYISAKRALELIPQKRVYYRGSYIP